MSLFSGVREDVRLALGLRSLDHKKDLLRHRQSPLTAEQGRLATQLAFKKVRANAAQLASDRASGSHKRSPSAMNWRMDHPVLEYDPVSKLDEVGLEREILKAFRDVGNTAWWNQVPVASGLYGKSAGKRRAIDLVRRRNPSTYDFIELKVDSNRPLYAAIEILEYGFAWYFSRLEPGIGYKARIQRSLLSAERVHLSVLAPTAFYFDASYNAFGEGIAAELDAIAGPARMTFDGFKKFDIAWDANTTPEQLRAEMDRLYSPAT